MPPPTRLHRWRQKWRRLPPWGKITAITGIVVGLTSSIVGTKAAWPMLRLGLPAIILYVDGSLEDAKAEIKLSQNTTTMILRDLQIEQAEGKRDAAKNDIAKWTVEMSKTKDLQTQDLINKNLRDLNVTYDRLQEQIKSLNQLRALQR